MFKMKRTEVKNKLRKIIIKMLSSDSETDEIPDPVVNNILQYYGCSVSNNSHSKDDLDIFLKKLQKYIQSTHRSNDDSDKNTNSKFDLTLYDEYLEAETEYCEVTLELVKLLEEVVKYKETYSEYFKDECKTLDTIAEVLNKRCQFLKVQCLLKFYAEENTLEGHLALRNRLKEELSLVKERYEIALDCNKYVREMKDFEELSGLFQMYKDLKNKETAAKVLAEL